MSLRTAHIVLIGTGVAFMALLAGKSAWLYTRTAHQHHLTMLVFGAVCGAGLAAYLVAFIRKPAGPVTNAPQ